MLPTITFNTIAFFKTNIIFKSLPLLNGFCRIPRQTPNAVMESDAYTYLPFYMPLIFTVYYYDCASTLRVVPGIWCRRLQSTIATFTGPHKFQFFYKKKENTFTPYSHKSLCFGAVQYYCHFFCSFFFSSISLKGKCAFNDCRDVFRGGIW